MSGHVWASINSPVPAADHFKLFYSGPVVYKHQQQSPAGSGALSNYFIHVRSSMIFNKTALRVCWLRTTYKLFYSCPVVYKHQQEFPPAAEHSLIILFTSDRVWYSIKQPCAGCGPLSNYFIHVRLCISISNSSPPAAEHSLIILFASCLGCGPLSNYFIHVRPCMHIKV